MKECSNLENGLLEHLSLHLVCVLLVGRLFRFLERALGQLLDNCNDFLDRDNHMYLGVMGENNESDSEYDTREQGRCDLVRRSLSNAFRVGDSRVRDKLFTALDLTICTGIWSESDKSHLFVAPWAVVRDDEATTLCALLPVVWGLHVIEGLASDGNFVDL